MIDRAIEQKAVHELEVAEGQRTKALQVQAAQMPAPPMAPSVVSELQEKIATLVKERDAVGQRPDQPGVSKQGISDRNCDLRNALEFGDPSFMTKIGLLDKGQSACGNWQRRGQENQGKTVAPTLLDSLAEDLCGVELDNELFRDQKEDEGGHIHDLIRCADREVDQCSSAGSESRWGEMEDIGDEVVDWGTLPHPTLLAHAVPAHHVVECDRVLFIARTFKGDQK